MALKKKKTTKFENEQLYMLEILVDCLNLCPEKIINNEKHDLMIRVNFIDFTSVDIIAKELAQLKDKESKNKKRRFYDECINYEGKTCLFIQMPSNLIRSIKSNPLSVEVYRNLREKDRNPRDDAGQVLICAATAFLPVNFCNCVTMAKDKIDGLSNPYTLMQVYTLTDEQGHPCGSISMYLRLSCFGSSIINHLTLHEKSYVFRGFPLGAKFVGSAKLSDKNISDKTNRMNRDDMFSLLNKILDPAYSKLNDEKDVDTEARFALTKPESLPSLSMNQPGFEKLTSAEKLNDRKYRGFVYEIYPNEPTCSCLPTNQSTHPMICRSGCVHSCCMGLKNPDILKNVPSLAPDCIDNLHLSEEQDVNYDNMRIRGGKDTDNNHLNSNAAWNKEYTVWNEWYRNNNFKNRMKGGSDYGASAYAASEATVIYEKNKETGIKSPYKSRPETPDNGKSCVCPEKNLSSWRTGANPSCTKKPCVGADCMIRAFKEVQDFVDSIGKVPGLVGLGLMDPSESPYFRREIDKDYAVQKTPSEKKRAYPLPTLPNLQCITPYNTQISKPVVSVPSITYTTSIPMTVVPGRTGVVREAIPTFPEATLVPISVKKKKEEKKEEKLERQKEKELEVTSTVPSEIDIGPCGEPKCKSRRKKLLNTPANVTLSQTVEEAQKSSIPPSTISPTIGMKNINRFIKKHPKGKLPPGPSGDRNITTDVYPIKVSKRVMRHIYSIGDVYPGTNYGHKNCIDPRMRVPANMGWLWNVSSMVGTLKYPRMGWKPGAIDRFLNVLLKKAKDASLIEDQSRSKLTPSRTALRRSPPKLFKSISYISLKKEGEDEVEPPPTLHIHRKDGTYYVTMYPIRQEIADVPQLEEPMKPLQFKIVRNKDDASVATSSTASDMEIEFSPPAAVSRYRKKPDVIHVDTQVRQQEILDAFKTIVVDVNEKEVPKRRERRIRRARR